MKFVFNRDYVAASGKGFVPGQELPDGVLEKSQIDNLLLCGILKQVLTVADVVNSEPEMDEEDEVDPELDPIEALNPERKVRGRKAK